MDLIRRILLVIESDGDVHEIPNVDMKLVIGHVQLLVDAGLIVAEDDSTFDGADFFIERITWAGHEFLDAARNDSVWNTVRRQLKEKALGASLALLQQLLTREVKRLAGLD